jgi:hypothetical protein
VEIAITRGPKASTFAAAPARSAFMSVRTRTTLCRCCLKVSPPSVERRIPRGPKTSTFLVSGAYTAWAWLGTPASRMLHVLPPFVVRNMPPPSSSA